MNVKQRDLLGTVSAIYEAALTPENYESFVAQWNFYVEGLDAQGEEAHALNTHIDKALAILDRLHLARSGGSAFEEIAEQEAGAAAIYDRSGTQITANGRWVNGPDKNAADLWGISDDPEEQDRLRSVLRAQHEITEPRTDIVQLVDPVTDELRFVSIRRLQALGEDHSEPRYLVRTSQTSWSEDVGAFLAVEFDLTPAEVALLERMTLGGSFQEISDQTGRAIETLKSQAKSIYRKMHASGREDAVRLSLQFHLLLMGTTPPKAHQKDGNYAGTMKVTGGIELSWVERGASEGKPFLFLHGMTLGHGLTEEFVNRLEARNLKAICLERPGYGASDPLPDWRAPVDGWSKIVPDILDQLGLDRTAVVTHTSGVLYGCAAAAACPDKVSGVCAIAGGVPITNVEMLKDYPQQVKMLSHTGRLSPRALRFVLSLSTAFYKSESGRNRMIERTYAISRSDALAINDPEIIELVHDGFELISESGFDGFVGDGLEIFGDWSDIVRDLQCRLHYIIGEEDAICPLDWARAFAQQYGHVDVSNIAAAGQLLHHSHAGAVFDDMVEFLDRCEQA